MKVKLLHGAAQKFLNLPMWESELRDLLDRMECDPTEVAAHIEACFGMRCLKGKMLIGNAYWLNHLAEQIMKTDDAHRAAFKGLLDFYGVQKAETLVEWLYGTVPMQRVHTASDIRKIAAENGCAADFDEITADPYAPDVLEQVDALFKDICGGVVADGYFCKCAEYQPPEQLKVSWIPADVPFSMVCSALGDDSTKHELQFPCQTETIVRLRQEHAGKLIAYSDYQTLLPGLKMENAIKDLHQLNTLARQLTSMDRMEIRALKTVMAEKTAVSVPQIMRCAQQILAQRTEPTNEMGGMRL